jgi:hypothetical protein
LAAWRELQEADRLLLALAQELELLALVLA